MGVERENCVFFGQWFPFRLHLPEPSIDISNLVIDVRNYHVDVENMTDAHNVGNDVIGTVSILQKTI